MTRTTTDWVRTGDGVSISVGVVFYTELTYQGVPAICHSLQPAAAQAGRLARHAGAGGFTDTLSSGPAAL